MAGKQGGSIMPASGGLTDEDYQGQSDHRTLADSVDIQNNPTRMRGVMNHQTKQEKKLAIMRKQMGSKMPKGPTITGKRVPSRGY